MFELGGSKDEPSSYLAPADLPPSSLLFMSLQLLGTANVRAPSGQHLSPLPLPFAFVSAAITSSDLYQVKDVLTP